MKTRQIIRLAVALLCFTVAAHAQSYTPQPRLFYANITGVPTAVTSPLTSGQLAYIPQTFLAKCMNGRWWWIAPSAPRRRSWEIWLPALLLTISSILVPELFWSTTAATAIMELLAAVLTPPHGYKVAWASPGKPARVFLCQRR
jgi:hypothetical protein